jgi:hypothetical protein
VNGALHPAWTPREATGTRPRATQRLVAVPWRHPMLILACASVGAGATAALSLRQPAAPVVVARSHIQPILPSPDVVASAPILSGQGGPGLRLDLELGSDLAASPDEVVARDHEADTPAARVDDPPDAPTARLDDAHDDEIDALLKQSPPAAGFHPPIRPLDAVPPPGGVRRGALVPGLFVGLLLGLLAAAMRELRGDRMRSVREAEWALGVPVLGAIPTLSSRARGALLAPTARRDAAGPA